MSNLLAEEHTKHSGAQIEVRLGGAFQRKYTVKGLMQQGPADLQFFNEQDDKEMSVAAYYEERYHIRYSLCGCTLAAFSAPLWRKSGCMLLLLGNI